MKVGRFWFYLCLTETVVSLALFFICSFTLIIRLIRDRSISARAQILGFMFISTFCYFMEGLLGVIFSNQTETIFWVICLVMKVFGYLNIVNSVIFIIFFWVSLVNLKKNFHSQQRVNKVIFCVKIFLVLTINSIFIVYCVIVFSIAEIFNILDLLICFYVFFTLVSLILACSSCYGCLLVRRLRQKSELEYKPRMRRTLFRVIILTVFSSVYFFLMTMVILIFPFIQRFWLTSEPFVDPILNLVEHFLTYLFLLQIIMYFGIDKKIITNCFKNCCVVIPRKLFFTIFSAKSNSMVDEIIRKEIQEERIIDRDDDEQHEKEGEKLLLNDHSESSNSEPLIDLSIQKNEHYT